MPRGKLIGYQQSTEATMGDDVVGLSGAGSWAFDFVSWQDEQREWGEMDLEELACSSADVNGTTSVPSMSEREIAESLSLLDEEVAGLPMETKLSYLEAVQRCPSQVDERAKTAFLWREDFDVQRAARRLVRCWERKKELFGPEKCYMPLTLSCALKDDIAALSSGFIQILSSSDAHGRGIIFIDVGRKDKSKHSRESMLRAVWYMFYCASEDVQMQKRGCVFVVSYKTASYKNFDMLFIQSFVEFEKEYVPLRAGSVHTCYPPPYLRSALPVLRFFLGKRLRYRVTYHSGSEEEVLRSLARFGLAPTRLPVAMGGCLVSDHLAWMCDRLDFESRRQQVAARSLDVLAAAAVASRAHTRQEHKVARRPMEEQESDDGRQVKKGRMILATQVQSVSCAIGVGPLPPPVNNPIHSSFSGPLTRNLCSIAGPPPMPASAAFPGLSQVQAIPASLYQYLVGGVARTALDQSAASNQAIVMRQRLALGNSSRQLALGEIRPLPTDLLPQSMGSARRSSRDVAGTPNVIHPWMIRGLSLHDALQTMSQSSISAGTQGEPQITNFADEMAAARALIRSADEVRVQPNLAAGISRRLGQSGEITTNTTEPQMYAHNSNLESLTTPSVPPAAEDSSDASQPSSVNVGPIGQPMDPTRASHALHRLPRALYVPDDDVRVSRFQCLLRKQIEAFVATESHVNTYTRGRNRPVSLGQVGIRCRHCKGMPLDLIPRGSMYFPSTLISLYQTAQKMAGAHFCDPTSCCSRIPRELRDELGSFKLSTHAVVVGGGKRYWAKAAEAIGLADTPNGIRLIANS